MRSLALWIVLATLVVAGPGCRKKQATTGRQTEPEQGKQAKVEAGKDESSQGGSRQATPTKPGRPTSALQRYREDRVEPRVRNLSRELTRKVMDDPSALGELVQALMAGVDDPFFKARLIHDWVAVTLRYDVESYFSGQPAPGDLASTLRSGRSVCEGYATLLEEMCRLSGLECVKVSGYARGYGYDPLGKEDPTQDNHAWNAVRIQGSWYLMDPTWNSGRLEGNHWQQRFSTAYLFLEPEQFLYTHFPRDPRWQLLSVPLEMEEFRMLPYLRGEFFHHGMQLLTAVDNISEVSHSIQLEFEVPSDLLLLPQLTDATGQKLTNRALIQRDGPGKMTMHATLPGPGRYQLALMARPFDAPPLYRDVAYFGLDSRQGTTLGFPRIYEHFNTLRCTLLSPLHGPLAQGEHTFRLRVPHVDRLVLSVGEQRSDMSRSSQDGDVWEATAPVPEGAEVALYAQERPDDPSMWRLLEWQ